VSAYTKYYRRSKTLYSSPLACWRLLLFCNPASCRQNARGGARPAITGNYPLFAYPPVPLFPPPFRGDFRRERMVFILQTMMTTSALPCGLRQLPLLFPSPPPPSVPKEVLETPSGSTRQPRLPLFLPSTPFSFGSQGEIGRDRPIFLPLSKSDLIPFFRRVVLLLWSCSKFLLRIPARLLAERIPPVETCTLPGPPAPLIVDILSPPEMTRWPLRASQCLGSRPSLGGTPECDLVGAR